MKTLSKLLPLFLLVHLLLFSCQPVDNQEKEVAQEMQPVGADTSALKERRPAPDFFILSREQHKSRVWVCDDNISDIFHVKNDCPDFIACGSTMRNVSLARAIEDYGRYNCMTCSAELSAIFDEEKLRITN